MPRPKSIVALAALLFSSLACATLMGESDPDASPSLGMEPGFDPPATPAVIETIKTSCPAIAGSMPSSALSTVFEVGAV